ncbi:MAG: hypothetical protein WAM66_10500 [Acidobacteriaceae bacterium]
MTLEATKELPPAMSSSRNQRLAFVIVFLLALLARIPFYATHHVQEDAYITIRSAFHLADFGQYSNNLGEHASGVTSVLYGPMVAGVRFLFGAHAILALSVLNTIIFLLGAALLSCAFFAAWRERLLLFAAIAMLPVGLLVSYTDMETPLQVALFCTGIFTLRRGRPNWTTIAAILLLPLVRPDAIAYSLILSVLVFSFNKAKGVLGVVCSVAGVALMLLFNRLTTGAFITATMRAKEVAYHPSHSLYGLLVTAHEILVAHSYLLPLESKFLDPVSPLITLLALAGCLAALWLARRQAITFRLLLACFAAGVLIPGAYILGGVIFPWYLWTSNWLCLSLICFLLVRAVFAAKPRARIALLVVLAIAWAGMDGMQWLVSYNIGLQGYHYRGGIGRWLHTVAKPTDTLELEPAGYIPFYAGLRTYDEVGLISPLVVEYRTRYGGGWYMEFLKQKRPDWLVERAYMTRYVTMDGVHLSPQNISWFDAHYKLARHFHYSPENYLHSGLLLRLMKNGATNDFYVYHSTGLP